MNLLSNRGEGKKIGDVTVLNSFRFDTIFGREMLGVWVTLACVFMVRATLGYRPFPSVDDFVYVPLAQHWLDPGAFSKDELLTSFGNHQIFYSVLVAFGEATIGLPGVFFSATLLLTAITLIAIVRILRTLGGNAYLLPLVIALSVTISIRGLGRGAYDGLLGDGIHGQWIALVLSLFAFDSFLRGRSMVTGILLGLAVYAQAMVAFHSAFVIFVASLIVGRKAVLQTAKTAIAALVTSFPFVVSVGSALLLKEKSSVLVDWADVVSVYQFRAPHHYDLHAYPIALLVVVAAVGLASWSRFSESPSRGHRGALGLLLGLTLLFFFAIASYTIFSDVLPHKWLIATYFLDLTRSSPLLFVLSAVFVAVAFERHMIDARNGVRISLIARLSWLIALCAVFLLLITNVLENLWVYLAIVLGLITMVTIRWHIAPKILGPIWLSAGLAAATVFFSHATISALVEQEEDELYSWVKTSTPPESLFIVPPGLEQFRVYTTRSVFVDFKLVFAAQPELLSEWMSRLVQVSSPDLIARRAKGWGGVMEWNRTYASRNTPQRVAKLLRDTKSDYFVLDRHHLNIPPFVALRKEPAPELERAFENTRFVVYRLRG